jgi:hypothetical protein
VKDYAVVVTVADVSGEIFDRFGCYIREELELNPALAGVQSGARREFFFCHTGMFAHPTGHGKGETERTRRRQIGSA